MKNLRNRIGGAILALAFVFGLYAATSGTAQAQFPYGRDPYGQDRRDRNRDNRDRNRDNNQDQNRRRRNWDRNNSYSYGGSSQLRQTALNAGYNEGVKEGRRDRNGRQRYDFSDFRAYRDATKDYNSRLGDRELYRQYFRQGFQNGYADGSRGY